MKEFKKVAKAGHIGSNDAFLLFTTYGFPFEMTLELAHERGIDVDEDGFAAAMKKHRELSRAGGEQKFKGGLADQSEKTTRLHTAHHLLLKALQMVLGPSVKQRGSNITQERLRIDFSYGSKMTTEQIKEVERIVNEKIQEGLPMLRSTLPKEEAEKLGLDFFSTPFDASAVEFLEEMGVVAYKVASFENVDLPLLRRIAETGKPIIMSTGMATLAEIDEAVGTLRAAGAREIALLKCTSAYPAPPDEMNLRTIPHLAEAFGVPVGLSDHTLDIAVPVAAVALGAALIEKHFTLNRSIPGPDSQFSLEPHEFRAMVNAVRIVEAALGSVQYGVAPSELESRAFRRSLFVVRDIRAGELFSNENIRSIRPGYGLHTRFLDVVLGRPAARDIVRGTPVAWEMIGTVESVEAAQ